jgi:hypothetical protein
LSISIPADTEADCSVGTWVPLRRSRLARALTNPLSCIHPSLVLAIEFLLQPRLLASCSRLLSACAAAQSTNPLLSPAATGNPLSSSSSSLQPLPGQLLLVLPFGRLPACSLPPHIGPCSPRAAAIVLHVLLATLLVPRSRPRAWRDPELASWFARTEREGIAPSPHLLPFLLRAASIVRARGNGGSSCTLRSQSQPAGHGCDGRPSRPVPVRQEARPSRPGRSSFTWLMAVPAPLHLA